MKIRGLGWGQVLLERFSDPGEDVLGNLLVAILGEMHNVNKLVVMTVEIRMCIHEEDSIILGC